ncbi:MAG TPA: twin-arginine translocase subunit TatC [Vicinamibacterales bacterium]
MALVPFPGSAQPAPYDDPEPDDDLDRDDDGAGGKMSFLEHLDELRHRLIVSVIAVAGGFIVALVFINRIFEFVMRPLQEILPDGGRLIYTGPTEALMLQLKVAALAGLMIAAPVVMWQVWLFVAPGLYANEKRFALPFILVSSLSFVAGGAFSHFVVFPKAWAFLASFSTDYMEFLPRISDTFGLYAKMALAFALIFQMPTVVFALARMGVVTAGFLARQFKYAVLAIFIVSAIITPTSDPMNQTLMAGSMIVLYGVSILIAWAFGRGGAGRA